MRKIRQLAPEVISAIAAGQVVDRPASIVKELIENSLDAGAATITVSLKNAGLDELTVIDDGWGITSDDLHLAVASHATSKIVSSSDLLQIATLGFRGEALHSIGTVSQLQIKSRTDNQKIGHQLTVADGVIGEIEEVGMPQGTQIVVERLFSRVPARKKFLKSAQTELRHCIDVVIKVGLAHPNIKINLEHNGSTLLQFPEKQDLEYRIMHLLGEEFIASSIPISVEFDHIKLSGFIGKPQVARTRKKQQHLFVNGRSVFSPEISAAIKRAYKSLLEPRAHPGFVVFVAAPYELVDVNVHPQKREVKFITKNNISQAIQKQIEQVLQEHDLTYTGIPKKTANQLMFGDTSMDQRLAKLLKQVEQPWSVRSMEYKDSDILQLHNLYLVLETNTGMLLIDQHAAHEKIIYEQLIKTFGDQRKRALSVQLTDPVTLSLSLNQLILLQEKMSIFTKIGFTFRMSKESGGLVAQVLVIPVVFENRDIPKLVTELLDQLEVLDDLPDLDQVTNKTLSYIACRSAIKAGDKLSLEERRRLLKKLTKTRTAYTCPHGRPLQIAISLSDLEKWFKRK